MELRVRVNDELVLDAGVCEPGAEAVIQPPKTTLRHQVLDYLRSKPDPPAPTTTEEEEEGLAAAAVTLRWGSYFAVLADRAKPVWSEAKASGTSRICDSEMARINIESSAALAEWIDIARTDQDTYESLVARAVAYLPLPKVRPRSEGAAFAMLAMPEIADKIVRAIDADRLAAVRADADRHPTRLLANALVNVAWRNGPVEDIHAGAFRGYPLDQRRLTAAEERKVIGFAADRLTTGMDVCRQLANERGRRVRMRNGDESCPKGRALFAPTWFVPGRTRETPDSGEPFREATPAMIDVNAWTPLRFKWPLGEHLTDGLRLVREQGVDLDAPW